MLDICFVLVVVREGSKIDHQSAFDIEKLQDLEEQFLLLIKVFKQPC